VQGFVQSGAEGNAIPIANARIQLWLVGDQGRSEIAQTESGGDGSFVFDEPTNSGGDTYYLYADLAPQVSFLALIGAELPERIVVNELTTIAAVYCARQFFHGLNLEGDSSGLRQAARMSRNVVDPVSGASSPVLVNPPNADQTNALRSSCSLANLLAWCVRDPGQALNTVFTLTTPPGGERPNNTIIAMYNIARYPANEVSNLYTQSSNEQVYAPILTSVPDAWTLAVKVNDSGDVNHMFGGPGNLAFDHSGRAWLTNNVNQGSGESNEYCIVLDPDGKPAIDSHGKRISPFTGGGLLGTGYGVALDSEGNVWFGNFGWGKVNPSPSGSVSRFTDNAIAMSPEPTSTSTGGYQKGIYRVQGTAIDDDDNLWLAGYKSHTVAVYERVTDRTKEIGADPVVYDPGNDSFMPFGIALASDGTAWVVDGNSDQSHLVHLRLDSASHSLELVQPWIPFGKTAKGIAIDSFDNIWIASGGDNYVYAFSGNGAPLGRFNAGQIDGPWGVFVDGDDNVWVANFGPLAFKSMFRGRLTHLAGANPDTRPSGTPLGAVLSPPKTGYTLPTMGDPVLLANGEPLYGDQGPELNIPFMRVTAVNIDTAGNVWCLNNWKPIFMLDLVGDPRKDEAADPGGDGIVIFLGLAKPVKP
jgi:hypothetical protein